MSGEPHTSSAPTRADEKTRPKEFSPLQKLSIVCGVLTILGGGWFFFSGQAATTFDVTLSPTTVAETITTNPTLEDGLVGHWTFDGEDMDWSSTTAEVRDRSDKGNNGDAGGSLSTRSVAAGVLGQALKFNGTTDRVTVTSASALPQTALSVSAWVKRDASGTFDRIVEHEWPDVQEGSWVLFVDSADDVQFGLRSAGGTQRISEYVTTIELGTWHHLVGTYDGTTGRVYVDGVEGGTTFSVSDIVLDTVGDIVIAGAGDRFPGVIDDVRVYNRALSADEVKRLYQLGQ